MGLLPFLMERYVKHMLNRNEIFYGDQDNYILFSSQLQELAIHKNNKFLLRTLIHEYSQKLGNELYKYGETEQKSLTIKYAKVFFSCPKYSKYVNDLSKALTFLISLEDEKDFENVYKEFTKHALEMGYCPTCGAKLVKDQYCEWCHVSYAENIPAKEMQNA